MYHTAHTQIKRYEKKFIDINEGCRGGTPGCKTSDQLVNRILAAEKELDEDITKLAPVQSMISQFESLSEQMGGLKREIEKIEAGLKNQVKCCRGAHKTGVSSMKPILSSAYSHAFVISLG